MKRLILSTLMVLAFSHAAMAETDTETLLANAVKATANALVIVRYDYDDETGSRVVEGIGVCYDAKKGEFLTFAFDTNLRPSKIKNVRLILPGPEHKTLSAELLGIRASAGLGFVRAKEAYSWQAVKFAERSNVQIGQKVVSAGLMPGDRANTLYCGVGYISAKVRVPQEVYYVTGGRLTCNGSPVFGDGDLVIGLVAQIPFLDYDIVSKGVPGRLSLKGRQESVFYLPVEEFVYALKRIPRTGGIARASWIGLLNMLGVDKEQAELMNLDLPAAMVGQVIPGAEAEKAGLKNGDVIVALNGLPLERLASPEMIAGDLMRKIARIPSGQKITLTLFESGERRDVSLTVTDMPLRSEEAERYFSGRLGLLVRQKVMLDPYMIKSPAAKIPGLPVVAVAQGSPAASGGLKRGDLITAVNGQQVKTVTVFKQIVEDSLIKEPDKTIVMLVRRGDEEPQAISIRPPSP